MAYTTEITMMDTEGGQSLTADVTARVWMVWYVSGTGTGTGNMQQEEGLAQGLVKKDLSAPLSVNFPGPTNFAYASRGVGFSVQDTNRVGNDTGWLFRSGEFPADLPAESVEIVTATKSFTSTEVLAMIPPLPFTADASSTTVITAATITFAAGAIDFTAAGTTMATGTTLGFSAAGRLEMSPSSDIRAAGSEAINVGASNLSVTFTPGTTVTSAIEAAVFNAFSSFALTIFRPKIREALEKALNVEIARAIGRALQTGNTLPPGVVLSIRSIRITADPGGVLEIRAALGAYGGVFSKLPPIQISTPTPGKPCFIATAVHGIDSPEVELLRSYRDEVLADSRAGRRFISLYQQLSPPIANYIAERPLIKSLVRKAIVRPGYLLAKRGLGKHKH